MLRFFAGRRSRLLGLVRNGTRLNSAAVRLTRDEARGVSVTSTAAWTVARTTVPAAPTLLGPAAEEALRTCEDALKARGHAANMVLHYSENPTVVASAIGGGPAACIGLRAVAWAAPTEVDADTLDNPKAIVANAEETQAVSVVAVSLPGLRVDAWRTKSPSVPALPDLEGALTTRPPHLLFLASPSFQLETFTRVLGQAFPASAKSGCRAFSGMELSDEVANNVRIVQPSEMPALRGSIQVLDLQGGNGSVVLRSADAATAAAAVARVLAVDAAPTAGESGSADSSASAGPLSDVTVGSSGEEDPFAVGVAIAAKDGPPLAEDDFVDLVRHIQGDLRAAAYYFSDTVVRKLFTPQGIEPSGGGPSLTERNRILDAASASESAVIPLLEIGVLAFPDGSEELIIFELRYRLLLKGLFEGTRKPRVFGLTVGGVGTLATLGAYNMMPDGRARVTVHAGRRFSIVPGSTRAEPSTFGMVVGEVRFFDDNKAHDEGAQNKGLNATLLAELVSAAERQCQDLLERAKARKSSIKLALTSGGTLKFEESIQHQLFHAEGRRGESRAERLSMELASILPTSHWVRARWLRERDSQRRLEQQLLTLKAAADEIVQSWAVQFYGAKGSTMFRRDSRESGVKRTGF